MIFFLPWSIFLIFMPSEKSEKIVPNKAWIIYLGLHLVFLYMYVSPCTWQNVPTFPPRIMYDYTQCQRWIICFTKQQGPFLNPSLGSVSCLGFTRCLPSWNTASINQLSVLHIFGAACILHAVAVEHPKSRFEKGPSIIAPLKCLQPFYFFRSLFPLERQDLTDEIFQVTKIDPTQRPMLLTMEDFNLMCHAYYNICQRIPGMFDYNYR